MLLPARGLPSLPLLGVTTTEFFVGDDMMGWRWGMTTIKGDYGTFQMTGWKSEWRGRSYDCWVVQCDALDVSSQNNSQLQLASRRFWKLKVFCCDAFPSCVVVVIRIPRPSSQPFSSVIIPPMVAVIETVPPKASVDLHQSYNTIKELNFNLCETS